MKNLKLLRKSLNLTQDKVAESIGIPKPTYAHYEVQRHEPDLKTLIKIADFFNCSIDYLLGHQTSGILHLDSFTPTQRKLIEIIKQLNTDQTLQVIGYCTAMLNQPFDAIKPQKPW